MKVRQAEDYLRKYYNARRDLIREQESKFLTNHDKFNNDKYLRYYITSCTLIVSLIGLFLVFLYSYLWVVALPLMLGGAVFTFVSQEIFRRRYEITKMDRKVDKKLEKTKRKAEKVLTKYYGCDYMDKLEIIERKPEPESTEMAKYDELIKKVIQDGQKTKMQEQNYEEQVNNSSDLEV